MVVDSLCFKASLVCFVEENTVSSVKQDRVEKIIIEIIENYANVVAIKNNMFIFSFMNISRSFSWISPVEGIVQDWRVYA